MHLTTDLMTRLLIAAGILVATFMVRLLLQKVILRHVVRLTALTSWRHDDLVVEALKPPVMAATLALGCYLALESLPLPTSPLDLPLWIGKLWHGTLAVLSVWVLYRLVTPLAALLEDRLFGDDEAAMRQFAPIMTGVLRFMTVSLAALFIAHNMGYQVTSLLAGLGIGGLAVALAAQDTLANILGTVVVLSAQPFRVGDWVMVDGQEGVVESIGFRSTRIRTFSRSLIVVPNKLLTERQIENWSAMNRRRVKLTLGLTYNTPPAAMEGFVESIHALLKADPDVDQESLTVAFTEFNSSSLDVLVVYFTHAVAYPDHLVVRQRLNLAFLRLAAEQGLSFAYPTRTVLMASNAS